MRQLFPVLYLAAVLSSSAADNKAEIEFTRRIWNGAPHNAFTDLLHFRDQWFCSFREGKAHVSPDGAARILVSKSGLTWTPLAHLTHPTADLRDPKLSVTPEGQLMLTCAGAMHQPAPVKHQTFAWFSRDGTTWSEPVPIGEPNYWLWRVTWHRGTAYGVGYHTVEKGTRLYSSKDGKTFDVLVPQLFTNGFANEATLVFRPDNSAVCLLRRDGKANSALVGAASPPYTNWVWKDLGVAVGGPNVIRLMDNRLLAAGRLSDGAARTSLMWLDPEKGTLTEFLKLPSGGDTSYPGMDWFEGLLWISYYSSHEKQTSIYFSKVKLPF